MKRRLTAEEEKYTRRGIRSMTKELAEYEEEKKALGATLIYLIQKRDYEDSIRDYNRKKQDKEYKGSLSLTEAKIQDVIRTMKIDNKKLREGIEQKENIIVK